MSGLTPWPKSTPAAGIDCLPTCWNPGAVVPMTRATTIAPTAMESDAAISRPVLGPHVDPEQEQIGGKTQDERHRRYAGVEQRSRRQKCSRDDQPDQGGPVTDDGEKVADPGDSAAGCDEQEEEFGQRIGRDPLVIERDAGSGDEVGELRERPRRRDEAEQ